MTAPEVWHHSVGSYVSGRWSPACGAEFRRGITFQTYDPLAVTCPECAATSYVAEAQADPERHRARMRGAKR